MLMEGGRNAAVAALVDDCYISSPLPDDDSPAFTKSWHFIGIKAKLLRFLSGFVALHIQLLRIINYP